MVVDAPALTPGLFGRLWAGVVGGLAGGVGFGILMQTTGAILMVASLVEGESALVGWLVHMSIAGFVGTTYALIFGPFSVALTISTLLGVFYGLVWWVLGGLTLMPLRLGAGLFVLDTAAWQSLAGHVAYGLALGVGYAVVGQTLTRVPGGGDHRRVAGDDRPPVVPGQPAPPPGYPEPAAPSGYPQPVREPEPERPPAPFRPPAAGQGADRPAVRGGGLTPLPPHARALRERRPGPG